MSHKHSVRILWGLAPEPDDTPQTYEFDTEAELSAFRMGVEEGNGWLNYEILEEDEDTQEEEADVAQHS